MDFHPDPLIFTHMYKSGGTTLQSIVKRQYRGASLYHFTGRKDNADAFRALPHEERHRLNLLIGHMYFGMHEWIRPGAAYMTMLRDPIERVISFYYFVRRRPTHYLWQHGFTEATTLRDFLEQRRCIELDNFQTRNLCPEPEGHLGFGKVTPAMSREALDNLDRYAVVGVTEYFDDSLCILSHRFGWQDVSYAPLNVTHERPGLHDIESSTIDLIREFNACDVAVYERACTIFERQLAEAGSALDRAEPAPEAPDAPDASEVDAGGLHRSP
jgi:hypothetical protein